MKTLLHVALITTVFIFLGAEAGANPVDDAMNADRSFARMAQDKGVAEAFGAYAAPSALRFLPGAPERGPAQIKASVAAGFAGGGSLNWEPKEGSPSADGSQVVVWGRWVFKSPKNDKGAVIEVQGTYLTVWQRQPDGSWKWTHDIGNSDPRPKTP